MQAPVVSHQPAKYGFLDFLSRCAQALPFEYRQIAVDTVIALMGFMAKWNNPPLTNVHFVVFGCASCAMVDAGRAQADIATSTRQPFLPASLSCCWCFSALH